jgi:prepilin-type N-terminal cleavage/methylation domain-containing protein
MRSTATNAPASRRLAVEWLEQVDARPAVVELRKAGRALLAAGKSSGASRKRGAMGARRLGQQAGAFTLLELMVVVAIISFLAAATLPHVAGYNRANTVSVATRQLLDDVGRARSRALANRSTVYMVFVPAYWNIFQSVQQEASQVTPQFTNLLGHQYMSYALLSARTVGDQPGQHFQHYLTEWQTVPIGVYIWPGQFDTQLPGVNIWTTNTFNGSRNWDVVYPFATNQFPFPSVNSGTWMNLPYIGFTPQGTLLTPTNQYIVITRGSIFYPQGSNGVYLAAPPNVDEIPPGNETNNPCMIKIDWLTARGSIVQNQFQ